MANKIYVLRIELKEIKPVIWRRFIVPSDIILDRLHDIIQIVMGFNDSHLHEFNIGGIKYTEEPELEYMEEDDEILEEGLFALNKLVKLKDTEFEYLYDFGDNWSHSVILERTNYKLKQYETPVMCMAGKRACPPDDVGGVGGYENFCSIMTDKSHPEYKEYKTWFGYAYDPEFLDIDFINNQLLRYMRWSRERLIPYEFKF
jgi:hypothetical protein